MQHVVRIAVAAWFATGVVPAPAAAPPDEIGVLTCTVGPIVNASASGTSVGNEAREMLCSFKTGQGPEETYAALMISIGGRTAEGRAILWSVRLPSERATARGFCNSLTRPTERRRWDKCLRLSVSATI